jgi:hypothetical protein
MLSLLHDKIYKKVLKRGSCRLVVAYTIRTVQIVMQQFNLKFQT